VPYRSWRSSWCPRSGERSLASALTAPGQFGCPGENVGEDGEEHPGPMRPGDTRCSVPDAPSRWPPAPTSSSGATGPPERRHDVRDGALLLAYGTAGTLLAWRATRPV